MSNEEFERKMEFILEQQAQFTADIGQLKELITQLTDDIIMPFAQATLSRFEATDKRLDEVDERIAALVNSQIQTEENIKQTTENLRNLVAVVDRYFSEGRNGKSEGQ
jgi:ABC-type transporter Mla subunit MlaD